MTKDPVDDLRAAIERHRLTQRQVGDLLGVRAATVNAWLKGQATMADRSRVAVETMIRVLDRYAKGDGDGGR